MIVKDLIELRYDMPFVIDGVEYDEPFGIPKDIQLSLVEKIDVRQDSKDGFYKAYIDIYKVEDPI